MQRQVIRVSRIDDGGRRVDAVAVPIAQGDLTVVSLKRFAKPEVDAGGRLRQHGVGCRLCALQDGVRLEHGGRQQGRQRHEGDGQNL